MGKRASAYQTAAKNRFGPEIAQYLSAFDHIVEPQTDLTRLRDWHHFPDLHSARKLDQIQRQRKGRALSLSELSIAYAPGTKRSIGDHSPTPWVIEVASLALGDVLIVSTPSDTAYDLRSSTPNATAMLTQDLQTAILSLSGVMPAGRPYLVFMPGSLVVLVPTNLADRAFHVPPYWVRLDPALLLAQFASDLAVKSGLINAALALPETSTTACVRPKRHRAQRSSTQDRTTTDAAEAPFNLGSGQSDSRGHLAGISPQASLPHRQTPSH